MDSGDDDVRFSAEEKIVLGNDLIRAYLYNYVRLNYIEVTSDKSRGDLMREAAMLVIENLHRFEAENSGEDIKTATNLMPDLLKSISLATDKVSRIILAAVWVEHWINGMIMHSTEKKDLPDRCYQVLSRKLGPIDKIEALWPLLDLEEMTEDLRRMIQRVIELRNLYVHYKWPYHSMDQTKKMDGDLTRGAELVGQVIRKILEYEDVNFHGGRAAELYGNDFYNFDE